MKISPHSPNSAANKDNGISNETASATLGNDALSSFITMLIQQAVPATTSHQPPTGEANKPQMTTQTPATPTAASATGTATPLAISQQLIDKLNLFSGKIQGEAKPADEVSTDFQPPQTSGVTQGTPHGKTSLPPLPADLQQALTPDSASLQPPEKLLQKPEDNQPAIHADSYHLTLNEKKIHGCFTKLGETVQSMVNAKTSDMVALHPDLASLMPASPVTDITLQYPAATSTTPMTENSSTSLHGEQTVADVQIILTNESKPATPGMQLNGSASETGKYSAIIHIQPPALGHIQASLKIDGHKATLMVEASTHAAHDIIATDLPALRKCFEQANFQLADIQLSQFAADPQADNGHKEHQGDPPMPAAREAESQVQAGEKPRNTTGHPAGKRGKLLDTYA